MRGDSIMPLRADPVVHIPLYSADGAWDEAVRYMCELLLTCLGSYFAHGNTYDLLVTTNDWRTLEVLIDYQAKTRYPFDMRLVSRDELRRAFHTDESRLSDYTSMRTIFSKFYPIMTRQCDAIVHVDCDTIFLTKVDLSPLLVSGIGLVDANQFRLSSSPWSPTDSQAAFFGISKRAKPVSRWINSGVFAVQGAGFELCQREVRHYLENLEHVLYEGYHGYSDEIIMNALAVRERKTVTVLSDYRYNFLAYYLKHDPAWTKHAQIVHFHSLKPSDAYWYDDGVVRHRCDEAQAAERISEDFYLAVLMWFRHLHTACNGMRFEFPTLSAMPLEVVERELATRRHRSRVVSV